MFQGEDDILAEVMPEGEPAFQDAPESQPEKSKTEDAPSQEGDKPKEPKADEPKAEAPVEKTPVQEKELPFHKNPRLRRIMDENKATKAELQALKEQIAKFQETAQKKEPTKEDMDIPDEFKGLFGEDVKAYKNLMKFIESQAGAIYETKRQAEERQRQEAELKNKEFVSWAENELEELGDEISEDLSDTKNDVRNRILSICEQYHIMDENGKPNFRAANELRLRLEAVEPDERSEKKKIAGKTKASSGISASADETITSSKLKKMNYMDFFRSSE